MALPKLFNHPALARWQGRLPSMGLGRGPAGSAGLPVWVTGRHIVVLLLILGVLVFIFMARLFFAGGASAGGPQPLRLATPPYQATYPAQVFTARAPVRNVVFTNIDNTAPTFNPADFAKLKNLRIVSSTSAGSAVMEQRAYLAQKGYSWSEAGFLEAARKGDVGALQAYLQAGMPVGARNAFSSTALHAATEANQVEAAKLLLAAGANVNVATTNLQTPLHRAVALGLPGMTQLLLAAGANPDAATLEGWTPLFYAVDTNNQQLTKFLIQLGNNPNRQDRYGNTPLMIAVRKNYIDISRNLIQLGAGMNTTDLMGRTALHYAVSGGYYQLTKMLLENGAKADVQDRNGQLPMDVALANQDLSIANLLLANGAKRPHILGTGKRR